MKVIAGRYENDTGLIVRVEDNIVVLFSDLTMHEVHVYVSSLTLHCTRYMSTMLTVEDVVERGLLTVEDVVGRGLLPVEHGLLTVERGLLTVEDVVEHGLLMVERGLLTVERAC